MNKKELNHSRQLVTAANSQVLLMTILMVLFYPNDPTGHSSVTMNHYAQCQALIRFPRSSILLCACISYCKIMECVLYLLFVLFDSTESMFVFFTWQYISIDITPYVFPLVFSLWNQYGYDRQPVCHMS